MTDFAALLVADRGQKARPIHLVDKESFAGWLKGRPAVDRALLAAHRFDGKTASPMALLPRGEDFEIVAAVDKVAALTPWCLASLAETLPEGDYRLSDGEPGPAALGWLLAQHRFRTYKTKKDPKATLFHEITYEQALRDELKIMDLTAFTMAKQQKIPLVVFNLKKDGNIARVVRGEKVGTRIHP